MKSDFIFKNERVYIYICKYIKEDALLFTKGLKSLDNGRMWHMNIGKICSFTLVKVTGPTVCAPKFLLTISSWTVPVETLVYLCTFCLLSSEPHACRRGTLSSVHLLAKWIWKINSSTLIIILDTGCLPTGFLAEEALTTLSRITSLRNETWGVLNTYQFTLFHARGLNSSFISSTCNTLRSQTVSPTGASEDGLRIKNGLWYSLDCC